MLTQNSEATLTMNLIKELYSNQLFHEWANKEHLFTPEEYLLTKYLKDATKRVVEAGTGGGRIIFFVESMGFTNLEAFDFVPQFITHAKSLAERKESCVRFTVADATNLDVYRDESFDYLIYLQQVLCSLPEDRFLAGLQEAYRVARSDSIAIFSFLNWDSRKYNPALSPSSTLGKKIY
jgi:SAM-dependent methyltransferase